MLLLLTGFSQISHAQRIYVKVQPAAPVVTRPPAPSPKHVWVEGEWIVENNNYVWKPGYWALPPRAGEIWIKGHWAREKGGSYWIPGHWRKV